MSGPNHESRYRATRALFAILALLFWGSLAWPVQIDDQYITMAYGQSLWDHGALIWTTGERVEGYSNFLLVLLSAFTAALALDGALVIKLTTLLCGAALVGLAGWRAPMSRAGDVAVAALALWYPLAWWSYAGMETVPYTLLLSLGWLGVLQQRPGAVGWLALASLTRLEGGAQLLIGALARGRRLDRWDGLALAATALYHGIRTWYFGAFFPTPVLVKTTEPGLPWERLSQFGQEALSLVGVGAALLLLGRPRLWVLAPLLIQAAVELRADTDWMGHARLLLPGAVATALAWITLAPPTAGGRAWPAVAGVALLGGLLDPPGIGAAQLQVRDLDALLHLRQNLTTSLDTPVMEDVAWVVANVPDGGAVLTGDVGMVGNIPGVRVYDLNGLTSRPIALFLSSGGQDIERYLGDYYAALGDVPRFVRLADGREMEAWMGSGYVEATRYRQLDRDIFWYATSFSPPPLTLVQARWAALVEAFPSQGWLRRQQALALLAGGDLAGAITAARAAAARWPGDQELHFLETELLFPPGSGATRASQPFASGKLTITPEPNTTVIVRWSCNRSERRVRTPETIDVPTCADGAPAIAQARAEGPWVARWEP